MKTVLKFLIILSIFIIVPITDVFADDPANEKVMNFSSSVAEKDGALIFTISDDYASTNPVMSLNCDISNPEVVYQDGTKISSTFSNKIITFTVTKGGKYTIKTATSSGSGGGSSNNDDSSSSSATTTTTTTTKTTTAAKTVTLANGDKKQTISTTESLITKTDGTSLREISVKGNSEVKLSADSKLVPTGAVLAQKELTKDSEDYKVVEEAIKNNSDLKLDEAKEVFAYDFDLTKANGTEIHELDGYVEVSLPVPSNINVGTNQHITAYRVNSDGSLTKCDTEVKDGVITFKTNHFSTYIFALEENEVKEETAVTTTDTTNEVTEEVTETASTVSTGVKLPIIIVCVVVLAGIIFAVIKVKNNK